MRILVFSMEIYVGHSVYKYVEEQVFLNTSKHSTTPSKSRMVVAKL